MVQAGLQDSILIQRVLEVQNKLNTGFDWQTLLIVIGTCISIPLCIWLINVVRGVNTAAVDKINTSLENLGNKFEEMGKQITKVIIDNSQMKTEQENLKDELYEILKTTKDLIESKHQIELTIIDLKNKHDAVNNMALRTNENLEDLQAKLEQIESSLEEYKKKQELCINYKPLRS